MQSALGSISKLYTVEVISRPEIVQLCKLLCACVSHSLGRGRPISSSLTEEHYISYGGARLGALLPNSS